MTSELIRALVVDPEGAVARSLFEDDDSVFWVGWREDDGEIAGLCEAVLKSGELRAAWQGEELEISFRDRVQSAALTRSFDDRHITLLTINRVLAPDYEIRMVWASDGSDTAAFAPLACDEWHRLESELGRERLDRAFLRLTERPNVYTDRLVRPRAKPWWQFW